MITAVADRDGRWWSIRVSDVAQATQVRRLDQAEAAVRELVTLLESVPQDSFDVELTLNLPAEVSELVVAASAAKGRAAVAQAEASNSQRFVARQLTAAGYTTRDVGRLLGLTHQRVAQLLETPLESLSAASLEAAFGAGNRTIKVFEVGKGWRQTTARELVEAERAKYPSSGPPKGFKRWSEVKAGTAAY